MAAAQIVDLAGVQAVELRMLAALDEVSRRTGRRYFLAYGSALGAVRDGRQIAWDWDMDVLVPIDDYAELVAALRSALPADLRVADGTSEMGYGPMFARIAVSGLHHSSAHLDLFPLVGASPRRRIQSLVVRFNHIWSRIHVLKTAHALDRPHYDRRKRTLVRLIRAATFLLPRSFVRRVFWWVNSRWSYSRSSWLHNPCGPYGTREFFPAAWFAESRDGELSGQVCRLPVEVEAMLTSLYGDYLTPVPPDKQREAHEFFEKFILPRIVKSQSAPQD